MFKVVVTNGGAKSLGKISREISKKIQVKVHNYLALNPYELGEALTVPYKGLYRYRCAGDYRVIYKITEATQTITVIAVGHRGDIYKKIKDI